MMKINVFDTPDELASKFNEYFFSLCSKAVVKEKPINVALSGGSTPKIIFQELAKNYKDKIDWSYVNFYWGDERCVSPDDEESNYGMTKKFLLDKIKIPSENIHRIKGEAVPEEEAKRYSEEIKSNLPAKNNLPEFDLVMLGLGTDGHTASIFPNQLYNLNSVKICEKAEHPKTKQKRITITGKLINNADEKIFIVTGEKKTEIVRRLVLEKEKNINLPAAHIEGAKWFLDYEAAIMIK